VISVVDTVFPIVILLTIHKMPNKATLIKEAQKYLAKGQVDKAIETWEKLIKEYPDGNTYNALGDLYLKKGDKKNSLEAFHKAATFFMNEGFSLKALGLFKKILNINPSDPDALFALGQINEERGLKIDAIKYYLSAADSLTKEGQKEKLFEIYERIITISPSNVPFRVKVAEIYIKEGLLSEAAREYLNVARLYEEKEETEKALEYYQKSLEIQPSNKETITGLTNFYMRAGNLDLAVEQMKNAISLFPQDTDVYLRCAEIYSDVERFDDAIACLSLVTEKDPSNVAAARLFGKIYIKNGDREKAWTKYRNVLDEMLLDMNSDDAIELLESFKDIDPLETGKRLVTLYRQHGKNQKVAEELIALATMFTEKGMQKEAVNCYREALLITPADDSLRAIIADLEREIRAAHVSIKEAKTVDEAIAEGEVFLQYGLYEDARNLLEDLREKAPDNIELHLKLEALYMNTDNKDKAITECLVLYDLYGNAGDTEARDRIIKEAFSINPEDPRLLGKGETPVQEETVPVPPGEGLSVEDYSEEIAEADFYAKQGLKDEAKEILEKLQKLFPEREEIKQKLIALKAVEAEEESPLGAEKKILGKEITPEPILDSDILSIFNEFKKGLDTKIDEKDHETHYNLGLAYREIGLIDDAIREFQLSRDNPQAFLSSSSMLSMCYQEKGLYSLAIEVLKSTVETMKDRDEAYWALKYDLAEVYEKNGNLKEAFDTYTEVYGWNAGFRDVPEKMKQLEVQIQQSAEKGKSKDQKARISYL
jgi:tetratricopeptide (TPR) repeat protein